jgi:NAD binding domain of 6-phosphogluconate dehydrogenase
MGTAIARGLIKRGHEVRAWNRTPDNAHDALQAGARWAPTPNRLAVDSEVTISCLFDDEAVERVYLDTKGLLSGRVEGRLLIDMSTVSPGVHRRIVAQIKSCNAEFIECPVSGSPLAARFGMLVGFAAGEAAAFARAQPLLAQLCRRVEHVGPLGAGARTKLADNLLLAVFWQALGESLLLLHTSGINAANPGAADRRRDEREHFGPGRARHRHGTQRPALPGSGGKRAGILAPADEPNARVLQSGVARRTRQYRYRGLSRLLDRCAKAAGRRRPAVRFELTQP